MAFVSNVVVPFNVPLAPKAVVKLLLAVNVQVRPSLLEIAAMIIPPPEDGVRDAVVPGDVVPVAGLQPASITDEAWPPERNHTIMRRNGRDPSNVAVIVCVPEVAAACL